MALPARHFKVGFLSRQVLDGANSNDEHLDIMGLFNFVVRGMKFSYDYVVVEGNSWLLPNGTWTGVKGLLNRSEVDYVPAIFKNSGEDIMAFNYPFRSDEIVFITKKPEYTPQMMAMFRTLSLNVWLSLLACIILFALACFVALKHRYTLEDILLHVLAIGLNQEGNLVPRRVGEVMLLCTWTVAMTVFTYCFKSVLLSFLTFPPLGGVRNVPELAAAIRAGQYIACTYSGFDVVSQLPESPNEDIRVIGENILKNHACTIEHVLFQTSEYPVMALVHLRSSISYVDGTFYLSKDNMGRFNWATAVRKDFCCKDEMDMLVHKFLAAGIDVKINRYRNYIYTWGLSSLLPDSENTLRELTVTDLSGAFILLVVGHCLSVCVLILECWAERRERRRTRTV